MLFDINDKINWLNKKRAYDVIALSLLFFFVNINFIN